MLYFDETKNLLICGNKLFRREILFDGNMPVKSTLIRLDGGYIWGNAEKEPLLPFPGFDWERCEATFQADRVIFSSNYKIEWIFSFTDSAIGTKFCFCGDIPAPKETFPYETLPHGGRHLKMNAVSFRDKTDLCDTLVRKEEIFLYRKTEENIRGNIFILSDAVAGESAVLVKDAPIADSCLYDAGFDARASNSRVQLVGKVNMPRDGEVFLTHEIFITLCSTGKEASAVRRMLKSSAPGHYIMSNTWGDRSRDTALNEKFIKAELDTAEALGADVMQIDDGWQTGRTANSGLSDDGVWSEGYYSKHADFWEPDKEKFPNGLKTVSDYAKKKGISLGLWFSPDGEREYTNWERDAQTLIGLYRRFDVRYFKLDGIELSTCLSEKRFAAFCEYVRKACDGRVYFNLDVTAGRRPGYFIYRDMGSIFLENRYTDWGNYYPHNTLRNLWDLSEFIPAERLQLEVLNLRRNRDKYLQKNGDADPLCPQLYDADYVFASVLCACPLLWMEMQNLSDRDKEALTRIISVYRKYRNDFAEVIPWGSRPDGYSLTGFIICGRKSNYCVLLRENGGEAVANISVRTVLCTNDPALRLDSENVIFSRERCYLFAEIY